MLRKLKKISIGLILLFLLVVGVTITVVYLYEDKIKLFAIQQLNNKLQAKVKVEEIELNLWEQFPKASLKFTNTFIADKNSLGGKDTLLFAREIYLNFDLLEMLDGKYEVKKIVINEAYLNLEVNKSGEENYDIWRKDTSTNSSAFSFQLEEVLLYETAIRYTNETNEQFYFFRGKQIDFSGKFSEKQYDLLIKADVRTEYFKSGKVNYIQQKNNQINVSLKIDNNIKQYTINHGALQIENLNFSVEGVVDNQEPEMKLDLSIKGNKIDLTSAATILPTKTIALLKEYEAKGKLDFQTTIKGKVGKAHTPLVEAKFSLREGSFKEKTTETKLEKVSFNGVFRNRKGGDAEEITLENVALVLKGKPVEGDISILDFSKPLVTVHAKGEIDLQELSQFINSPAISELSGESQFSLDFSGRFTKEEQWKMKLLQSEGKVGFRDARIRLAGEHLVFSELSGELDLINNNLNITNLYGKMLNTYWELKGSVKNIVSYALLGTSLKADIRLKADRVLLDELISPPQKAKEKQQKGGAEPFALPKNIDLKLAIQANEMRYGKWNMTGVSGKIRLNNQRIEAKQVHFAANGGNYKINSTLKQQPQGTFVWNIKGSATEINISSLFTEFDNFGQEFVTDQNLQGKAKFIVETEIPMDSYMNLNTQKMYVKIGLNIVDGQLANQNTMLEIADYLHQNKWVRAAVDTKILKEKLKRIEFSKFSTEIEILNEKIFIPKSTIQSNVMGLTFSGTHGFDDNVDYHFNFRLREVLKKRKKMEEFGPVKDDGLGVQLFLHMFGNLDDLSYELDKEERKEIREEKIKQEKKDLKSILKTELGLFKNDTSVKEIKEKTNDPTFEIEWEEEDKKSIEKQFVESKSTIDSARIKKKNAKREKWRKKLGIEEEKPVKVKIELE